MIGTGIAALHEAALHEAALHEAAPASLEDVVPGYLAAGRGTAGLQLN